MTVVADAPGVLTPAPRARARSLRGPAIVAAIVVVVGAVLAIAGGTTKVATLDPESPGPRGSHAVAQLLRDRGVSVSVTRDETAPAQGTTVFAAFPERYPVGDWRLLINEPITLVLVDPDREVLAAVAPGVTAVGSSEIRARAPGCNFPAASVAGEAELGGLVYSSSREIAGCYLAPAYPSLVVVQTSAATVIVLGNADFMENRRLAHQGNAALAIGLLSGGTHVDWLLPRAGAQPTGQRGLLDLLPDAALFGALQLFIAFVFLALWRARRLGRVVAEPLPVVVRAAETVEGTARLYRSASARGSAAEKLRAATRARLRTALTVPDDKKALIDAISVRVGRSAGDVQQLLYGAAPADDHALVELATALDRLEAEVRRS